MGYRFFVVPICAWIAITSIQAHADNAWKSSEPVWRQSDDCARAAFKQYPDYTPESNAKRDRALRLCLARNHAPGRASTDPEPSVPAEQKPR